MGLATFVQEALEAEAREQQLRGLAARQGAGALRRGTSPTSRQPPRT